MSLPSPQHYRFEVALSFAGDNKRPQVRAVAERLREELGEGKVFFDEWFEAELAGHDAQLVLQNIYRRETCLVVTCVCQRYNEKPWTQEEWRAIQAFERDLRDAGAANEKRMRFLPLRFGDGEVDGIFETAFVPDVRERTPEDIALLILQRLSLATGGASMVGELRRKLPPHAESGSIVPAVRVMDAAIASHVVKGEPTELDVLIRLPSSPGLKGILAEDGAADAVPEDTVETRFELTFSRRRDGTLEPRHARAIVIAPEPDFELDERCKDFLILPTRDSERLTFFLTPRRTGKLRVKVELHWSDALQAPRRLVTQCVAHASNLPERPGKNVVHVPIGMVEIDGLPPQRIPSLAGGSAPSDGTVGGNKVSLGGGNPDRSERKRQNVVVTALFGLGGWVVGRISRDSQPLVLVAAGQTVSVAVLVVLAFTSSHNATPIAVSPVNARGPAPTETSLTAVEPADHAAYAKEAGAELKKLQNDDSQWVMPGKNYSGTRYSTLNEITPANVKDLKVAWSMSTGTTKGHEGVPLVVGSTMYAHSSFPTHVYAIDLSKPDHSLRWQYTAEQDQRALPVACCDAVHRGLNYAEGKILMISLDAQVIALDANTGKEVWKSRNGDPTRGETSTGAGLVVNGAFIVGISGGEFGVRGHVTAYDIRNGKRLWRAYSAGPDDELMLAYNFNAANPQYGQKEQGTKTWTGEAWKQGGGTTWGWYSYDPTLNLFYYSTGSPGTWNPDQRSGDNKWSMTLWARNPETGKASWAYQMTPHGAWDYEGVNESVLVDLSIDGKKVPALVHFDRNGFAYTLDRRDGTILVAEPFVHVNWAKGIDKKTGRPIEDIEKRTKQGVVTKDICPNAMGGKDQQPVAFSPRTNLFYVPSNNMCMDYEGAEVKYTAAAPFVGANVAMKPGPGGNLGELLAWNPTTGKKVWGIKEKYPAWSGVLATSSDLIFYGTMDGWFKAVHAETGKELWRHKVASGIIGAPMTFKGPDGKQYVAVYAGVGGWFGLLVSNDLSGKDPYAGLGAVGIADKSGLYEATTEGGMLYVFAI